MPVKQIPIKFKTSDGRGFTDKKEADRHEELMLARQEYEEARTRFGNALARTQKTADGQLFDFIFWGDYYYVSPGYFGMPELFTVSFFAWGYEFDDRDEFTITKWEQGRMITYRISQLYVDKRKAEIALLEAQEKWLSEQAAKVEELRARLEEAESGR